MAVARRLCPHAAIVPPRGRRYQEVSRQVFAILGEFTPLVEPLSIDEAFLDATGLDRLLGPAAEVAGRIKRRIAESTHLTCSIGVAPNKFLAKLGSDLDKPDGLTVIDREWIERELPRMPVGRMWGVGPATEAKLQALGVSTFGDLAALPPERLRSKLGSDATRIQRLARGEDRRPVVTGREARSISHEQTFGADVREPDAVRRVMLRQAEQVGRRLRKHGLTARTIAVKIRFGDFRTITRSRTLDRPTDRTDVIWTVARGLFDQWADDGFRPVRLIGVGASQLTAGGSQLDLFTTEPDERRRRLDRTTDVIERKFGPRAIHRDL